MQEKGDIIQQVTKALLVGDTTEAAALLRDEYPFLRQPPVPRAYSDVTATRVFIRDGFLDRYSGTRLVFPGTLRLLSKLLPVEFPFHPNWKMSETHPAYWELTPTVDHVRPVARGGADNETNWVTTSMLRNSAKSNWTLEELGWPLLPPGDFNQWDGLLEWFRVYLEQYPDHLHDKTIRHWLSVAKRALAAG